MIGNGFLDDAAILEMRHLAEIGMKARATVVIPGTATEVTPGNYQPSFSVHLQSEPCSIRPLSDARELAVAGSLAMVGKYRVKFKAGTNIPGNASIVIDHDMPGVPNPLDLTVDGVQYRTTEIVRNVLATSAQPGRP